MKLGMVSSLLQLLVVVVVSAETAEANTVMGVDVSSMMKGEGYHHHNNNGRVLQSSTPRVIAEVFECDEYMDEIERTSANMPEIGHELRLCIRPNAPTQYRNIVMRTVEHFKYYKNFGAAVQPAVENKREANLDTLLLCIPGQLTCSFKTRLSDIFFYGNEPNGTIIGSGEVTMQIRDEDRIGARSFGKRRLQDEEEEQTIFRVPVQYHLRQRDLQLEAETFAGGYAGIDNLKIEIPIKELPPPEGFEPIYEADDSSWWKDAPGWLKALIIIACILVLVMLISLCIMCCWAARREETPTAEAEPREPQIPKIYVVGEGWSDEEDSISDDDTIPPPTDYDVCFDADEHPGTKAFYIAVNNTVKEYPHAEFGPNIYHHIKNQLKGRRFFVCDDENQPDVWRLASKPELVELFGKEYIDARDKNNEVEGTGMAPTPTEQPRAPENDYPKLTY